MPEAKHIFKPAKNTYIYPIFKKDDPLDKTNYRPISILPTVSKIFKIILLTQLLSFSINFFCLSSLDLGKGTILNMPLATSILSSLGFRN